MNLFGPYPAITIDSNVLSSDEMETLARRDGFTSLFHMMQFWDGRLPFVGHVIHWKSAVQR
jgi:hypothetical protein